MRCSSRISDIYSLNKNIYFLCLHQKTLCFSKKLYTDPSQQQIPISKSLYILQLQFDINFLLTNLMQIKSATSQGQKIQWKKTAQ